MAAMMRQSGMLPTVRCSSCSAEIEISRMGDHICAGMPTIPDMPEPPRPPMGNRWRSDSAGFASRRQSPLGSVSSAPASSGPPGAPFQRPGRMPPPRIDPSAANRPFAPRDQLTPSSLGNPRSKSPGTPLDGRRTPLRSATSPLPRMPSPPSPEMSNLDCAFPPFPTSHSPHVIPNEPRKTTPVPDAAEPSPLLVPTSPKSAGGSGSGSVLQRMNTIAPGPFGIRNGQSEDRPSITRQTPGHRRTGTAGSTKDYTRPPNANGDKHFPRPSTAGSEKSHSSSASSGSGARKNAVEEPMPALPPGPFPLPNEQPAGRPMAPTAGEAPPFGNRSQTFPLNEPPSGPLPRRPSEPAFRSQQRRPTASGAQRPNLNTNVPRAPYGDESAPSPNGQPGQARFPPRSASRADGRDQKWPIQAPPVPQRSDYGMSNPHHTPRESHSSSGSSYQSDVKTGSSRSSPPLSDVPEIPSPASSKPASIDNLMTEIQTQMDDFGPSQMRRGPRNPPPGRMQPPSPRGLEKDRHHPGHSHFPESPMDPAVRDGYFRKPSFESDAEAGTPKPESLSPQKRPSVAAKGKCRGCGELIKGKSVSSADGQLTGRYHKHCFVCRTCKEPFETSTFYVHQNAPYCERHYHQLNNSVCQSCNRGIEGQYLETERRQKYHARCFCCQDCRKSLRDDYFEMNGRVYCELHAFRRAQQTAFLGPSGRQRNPERRRTRLMMM